MSLSYLTILQMMILEVSSRTNTEMVNQSPHTINHFNPVLPDPSTQLSTNKFTVSTSNQPLFLEDFPLNTFKFPLHSQEVLVSVSWSMRILVKAMKMIRMKMTTILRVRCRHRHNSNSNKWLTIRYCINNIPWCCLLSRSTVRNKFMIKRMTWVHLPQMTMKIWMVDHLETLKELIQIILHQAINLKVM